MRGRGAPVNKDGVMHVRKWMTLVLVGAPLLAATLWAVGGRENFTKTKRAVDVQVTDDLFGDTRTETHWEPGPILGIYPGLLDFVAPVAGLCAVAAGVALWRGRRRAARQKTEGGAE